VTDAAQPAPSPPAGPDLPVVLLSHRGPASFGPVGDDGQRSLKRGGGGLVSALLGLGRELPDAVWVCAATSEDDRAVAQERGGDPVQLVVGAQPRLADEAGSGDGADGPRFAVRLVDLPPEPHHDFYAVIANPLLWFVQHGMYGFAEAPDITERDHEAFEGGYVLVNERCAAAVVEQVQAVGGRALVMLHDYHFYLVADRVRQAVPDAIISHFVHIPWPEPSHWRALPPSMREPIMRGMLGNDVVAFHTRRDARNFLLCAQDLLDLPVHFARMAIEVDGREVLARAYPISIDVRAIEELADSEEVARHRDDICRGYRLDEGVKLVLRVDRTDPSKNIVRGFKAFDTLLCDHPELVGKVTFLAFLQPSRQDVPEYSEYLASIGALVAQVNARHGRGMWAPISLRIQENLPFAVAAYSICDVLMVNAVADGMNLVVKEAAVVNQRDGVLALSENTGAFEELGEFAVTLHPFDIQQQADALHDALTRPEEQRKRDRAAAADVVRRNDVRAWLRSQLRDLKRLEMEHQA
jgi:trehalose 6-phosphate synthase